MRKEAEIVQFRPKGEIEATEEVANNRKLLSRRRFLAIVGLTGAGFGLIEGVKAYLRWENKPLKQEPLSPDEEELARKISKFLEGNK